MTYIKGLVSVIIPTYKRTDTVIRAIDSVLNQTYKNIECIVVNDNEVSDSFSKDLATILGDYVNTNKIIYLEQSKHINGAAAINYGIRNAKGEFIAFLDDDDWWKPDKIQKQIDYLYRLDDGYGGVSTLIEFYQDGHIVRHTVPYRDGKIYKEILGREIDVATGSVLLKRKCLDNAGYFDEKLTRHQELQLLSYFTYKYKIGLLPEYLLCMENDDKRNRPMEPNQLRRMKRSFFKSVKPIMDSLSNEEQSVIYSLNRLDIVYICLKSRKYKDAFYELVKIMKNPRASIKIAKRIVRRMKEKLVNLIGNC